MVKNITYKLTFIDRTRFMPSSLSHLVGNCSEKKNEKAKCKYRHYHKTVKKKQKKCKIKYKDWECYLEYTNAKHDLLISKCLSCHWNYQKRSDEDLKKKFAYTFFVKAILIGLF